MMYIKRYYWKALTDDGLLKDVDLIGSRYSDINDSYFSGVDNPSGHRLGYDSKRDALIALEKVDSLNAVCGYDGEITLVPVYQKERKWID